MRKELGIFIFNDVEVLDFCGPFEVFSVTRLNEEKRNEEESPFKVCLISEDGNEIRTSGGMIARPDFGIENCPELNILLIPGGMGTRKEMKNTKILNWVKSNSLKLEYLSSVCTGALVLGSAGLLSGKRATTHWKSLDWMQELFPDVKVEKKLHFVQDGNLFTSAGISAGIDMSLKLVEEIYGDQISRATARHMEYPYPESDSRRISI